MSDPYTNLDLMEQITGGKKSSQKILHSLNS